MLGSRAEISLDLIGVITAVVALYGAVLSTYTLVQNRREKRRHIGVAISNGFIPRGADLGPAMLLIRVTNPGHRAVTIQCPSLRLPTGGSVVFLEPQSDVSFPHELAEGKNCTVWTEIGVVSEQLANHGHTGTVKLVAECDDAVGTTYRSKQWLFQVDAGGPGSAA